MVSCLFRQAYNSFLVGLLTGEEWKTPEELKARGWTLIDTGFTATPPGDKRKSSFTLQIVMTEDESVNDLCYLRPAEGKGMLVRIQGCANAPEDKFYFNPIERIAHRKLCAELSKAEEVVTGGTEELNSFLQFCKACLVSEQAHCPQCFAAQGWRTDRAFGTDTFGVAELIVLESQQPLPLCLLRHVLSGRGVLLNCDYDSAERYYKAAADKSPGIDLFQSDWTVSLLNKDSHQHS
jgi:hypothetical protein